MIGYSISNNNGIDIGVRNISSNNSDVGDIRLERAGNQPITAVSKGGGGLKTVSVMVVGQGIGHLSYAHNFMEIFLPFWCHPSFHQWHQCVLCALDRIES